MIVVNRYLFREVLFSSLLTLGALLALFSFFDLVAELGDLGRGDYTLGKILMFVGLTMPSHVYELVPISGLIGTMLALGQLAGHSELAVMRTSGLSPPRLASYLVQVSLTLTAIAFLFGEFIAPVAETAAQRLRVSATSPVIAQEFRSGLWVKDEHTFVNVREVFPNEILKGLTIYAFDKDYRLSIMANAESAKYEGNHHWELSNVAYTQFGKDKATTGTVPTYTWTSALTPDLLDILLIAPEQMSATSLAAYVEHLRENRQDAQRFEIALWGKYFYPVTILIMTLLALPFALQAHTRSRMGSRIFAGILIGIGYFIVNRVFAHLALLNAWPPPVAAMAPPIAIFCVAASMTWWVERR